jgi:excisionase family DNA binding protein
MRCPVKTYSPQTSPHNKIAYRIDEAVLASGLGRSTIYDEIKAGRLKSIKAAGRRLILRTDLESYLHGSEVSA